MKTLLPFHGHFNNFEPGIVGINYVKGDFVENCFTAQRVVMAIHVIYLINSQTPIRKVTGCCLGASEVDQGPLRAPLHVHTHIHTNHSYMNASEYNTSRQAGGQHLNCN